MTKWIKTPEPGIYPDVPAETYHKWDALSNSWLGKLDSAYTCPQVFAWERDNGPQPPSEAMQFGSMLHKLVLEGFDFDTEFAVAPRVDKRTKKGKETWAAFEEASAGKAVVKADKRRQAGAMADSLFKNHPTARLYLRDGPRELSLVWDDPATGIRMKARLDVWNDPMVVDLKSTINPHPRAFEWSMFDFGYHRQAAVYLDGIKALTGIDAQFILVAVGKPPPHCAIARPVGAAVIEAGRRAYRRALGLYAQCLETNQWPGYDGLEGTTETLELPEWALKQEGVTI